MKKINHAQLAADYKQLIDKYAVPEDLTGQYFISCETTQDLSVFTFIRKGDKNTLEVLLTKSYRTRSKDERDQFEEDVKKLAALFNCKILR